MQYICSNFPRDRTLQKGMIPSRLYILHARNQCTQNCADTLNTVPAQLKALPAPAPPGLLSISLLELCHSMCYVMASFPRVSLTSSINRWQQRCCWWR